MTQTELENAATKILNTTLPKQFEFIEGVKDVILLNVSFLFTLKLKIVLNKNWVEKNFSKNDLAYIQDDFESDGYSLLSPYTVKVYSDEKIDIDKVDSYIYSIISFLGIGRTVNNLIVSYIVE